MNCDDFNKIIHELADYKPMQVTVRDAGISHVALCANCATKLAGARILSTSLVVAVGAESEEAPARIKQNLLAAFASVHQVSVAPPDIERVDEVEKGMTTVERSIVDMSMGRRRRWWTAAAVAVAAVILLAVLLPIWMTALPTESAAPINGLKAGLVEDSLTPPVTGNTTITPVAEKHEVKPNSVSRRRRLSRQRNSDVGSASEKYQTVAQNTGEYLPLTYLAKSTAIDSGTIVRVELSQSALASLGIRMNFEGTSKSVKADVVIGDDGVAQAIRLVQ